MILWTLIQAAVGSTASFGNMCFFGVLATIYIIAPFFAKKQIIPDVLLLGIAAVTFIVAAIYFEQNGTYTYSDNSDWRSMDGDLLGASFIGAIATLTIGLALVATVEYGLWLKAIINNEGATQDNAKPEFTDEFAQQHHGYSNESDSDFDFEESAFSDGSDKPEKPPRAYEKRHPKDVDLWAYIDDTTTPEESAIKAMREIRKREEARRKEELGETDGELVTTD